MSKSRWQKYIFVLPLENVTKCQGVGRWLCSIIFRAHTLDNIIFTEFDILTLLLDIDEEFKTQLRDLTPSALSSENLVVKSINGGEVTCRGLLEYFKVIVSFSSL